MKNLYLFFLALLGFGACAQAQVSCVPAALSSPGVSPEVLDDAIIPGGPTGTDTISFYFPSDSSIVFDISSFGIPLVSGVIDVDVQFTSLTFDATSVQADNLGLSATLVGTNAAGNEYTSDTANPTPFVGCVVASWTATVEGPNSIELTPTLDGFVTINQVPSVFAGQVPTDTTVAIDDLDDLFPTSISVPGLGTLPVPPISTFIDLDRVPAGFLSAQKNVVDTTSSAQPSLAALLGASIFPNPAQNSTALRLNLPAAQMVTVALTDLAGRPAAQPFAGQLPAGRHSLPLNVVGLPSGLYLVRVTTAQGHFALKLMQH